MNKAATPRFYFIPLHANCAPDCRLCFRFGCVNNEPRDLNKIIQLMNRAKFGGYTAIVFPSSFVFSSDAPRIIEKSRELELTVQTQIHWPVFMAQYEKCSWLSSQGTEFNFVFDGEEIVDWEFFQNLVKRIHNWHITLAPSKNANPIQFIRAIPPEHHPRLYFHFSPYIKGKNTLTTKETCAVVEKIKVLFPNISVRPPLGREVWDPRISKELALDSDAEILFSHDLKSNPKVSVVIPSFNSSRLLKNVLRHLLWQDLPREEFEVIVVDDGSTDGSADNIRNFIAPESGQINLKYLYFSRSKSRKRGDGNYRAGIARNQGVKHARGEILSFIDSDIIVPKFFLTDLIQKHEVADVIQCVRLHLKNKRKNDSFSYDQITPHRDTYILESNYWAPFFRTKKWQAIPSFWKYTCTYGLSVKTRDFKEAGWFRKTFVYYGFEDTDLGYRLATMGKRFLLNPITTYHLEAGEDRSEYRRSKLERHKLLSKTAKVFFLNTLDPAVFRHFYAFMGGDQGSWTKVKEISAITILPVSRFKSSVITLFKQNQL